MLKITDTKWDPSQYNKVADFVAKLGEPVIALLDPKAHHRILDLGCGDASLSLKLIPLCKHLIGVDASPEMVAAAKLKGIEAYLQDAHQLSFENEFDSVFSNAALHWMIEPEKVLSGIYTALKPGGDFVAEFGGYGNAGAIVKALNEVLDHHKIAYTNPWFFPQADEYSQLLCEAGFTVQYIELYDRFTPLNGHVNEWITTFAQAFLHQCTAAQLPEILNEVTALVADALFKDGIWHVDYVRLRLKAVKL